MMRNSPPSLLHLAARCVKLGLERGESFDLDRLPEEMLDVIERIYPDGHTYTPIPWSVVTQDAEPAPPWFDLAFERRIGPGDLYVMKVLNSCRVTRFMWQSRSIRKRKGLLYRDAIRITKSLKFSRRSKVKTSGCLGTRLGDMFVFYCPDCENSVCEANFIDSKPVEPAKCYSRAQHKFEIEVDASF